MLGAKRKKEKNWGGRGFLCTRKSVPGSKRASLKKSRLQTLLTPISGFYERARVDLSEETLPRIRRGLARRYKH